MSNMSAFPQSAMGLPSALKFDLPPSMSDSARSYSVNVAPDGITFVDGSLTSISHTAATAVQSPFSSQNVSFTIPSGMSDAVFMDCMNTTVSFTLTYTVSTALAATAPVTKLLSSASSWFNALQLYSNNTPIETINNYDILSNFLLQNTVSLSERQGGIGICMGTDVDSASGIDLGTAVGSYRYNFCVPLISVIGLNTDKFFPVGSVNNLQLVLTTAATTPIVCYNTAQTVNIVLSVAPRLSEFRLNMKYIDVGDVAAQMLRQTLQNGKWFIKSSTYTNSNVTIPANSSGTQQLLLQIRNSSVKSVYHQFSLTNTTLTPNGLFDAINPGLSLRQLQLGGQFFPNFPCSDCQRPAEAYAVLIQSLGGSIPKSFGTVVTREMYNTISGIAAVPAGSDTYLVLPTANSRAAPVGSNASAQAITSYPSSAFYGYDLERSSGILFNGFNTRSAPPVLNLTLPTAGTTLTISCIAFGYSDVVLQIDYESKQVTAFI